MSSVKFEVDLEFFNGPLELLLCLVREAEIDIDKIPIVLITEQYLEFIKPLVRENNLRAEDINRFSSYILLACVLLRMKIKKLLDIKDKFEEILTETEEPTVSFQAISEEFNRYKKIAFLLGQLEEEKNRFFSRMAKELFLKEEKGDIFQLIKSFSKLWANLNERNIDWIREPKIRTEDKIKEVREKIKVNRFMNFFDLLSDGRDCEELVVTFLVVLELARLGELKLIQEEIFGDILLIAL